MPADMSAENGENKPQSPIERQRQEEIKYRESMGGFGFDLGERYRPLDRLNKIDFSNLKNEERKEVSEVLERQIKSPFDSLSSKLELIIEAQAPRKIMYSAQNDLERTDELINQIKENITNVKEGENETILGFIQSEMVRQRSAQIILNWAIPYHSMAWSGMDSLRLISERGIQLPVADLSRFFQGAKAGWVDEGLKNIPKNVLEELPYADIKEITLDKVSANQDVLNIPEETQEKLKIVEIESFMDKFSRYTSEAFYWDQIRAEMNTYNPLAGEKLSMSRTTYQFVAGISRMIPRIDEFGKKEDIKDTTKPITIYFDENGKQVPVDAEGNPLLKFDRSEILFEETLDYYNTLKSENDRRWVIATTMAMCIHKAKERLDRLPENIFDEKKDENNPELIKYNEIRREVVNTANKIMENFDVFSKSMLWETVAKSAYSLSYSLGFGSFSVGDRGWSYSWKLKDSGGGKYYWEASGSQGDPTASGDAFTARRPYFHEAVYAGLKGRASGMNVGVMMPVNPDDANNLANALLSEAEEINQRHEMIERIKKGEQPHLAKYFGVIGAFQKDLENNRDWQEGVNERIKEGKQVNPNLTKAVETCVDFVPTPFIGKDGKHLVYPILMPQFQIALFDMLRVSDTSVGDVLRKTWVQNSDGTWREAAPKDGGRRRTLQDIDWKQYAPYADDGRAVNDNFISQIYTPLYGPLNPKNIEAITNNPMAALTSIIKAVDIGARKAVLTAEDGTKIDKPSLEIIYASTVLFQNLALGKYSLIGRGAAERFSNFLAEVFVRDQSSGKVNLYTSLRNTLDLLNKKGEYDHYADSFYLLLLAMKEALEPISVQSNVMASTTTNKMKETTGQTNFYNKNKNTINSNN